MALLNLELHHFRNFSHIKLDFNPGFNFFFGQNAQGKTNALEAIHYISDLKSFRTQNKADLIQKGFTEAHLKANVKNDDLSSQITIGIEETRKTVLLDGKRPASQKMYATLLPLLLFEPKHIYLFRDSPSERRRYLNRALYLQDADTLVLLKDFDKILTQKNKILKDLSFKNSDATLHLDVWNQRLAELGSQIILKRQQWFLDLSQYLAHEYSVLSQTNEVLSFVYKPSLALNAAQTNFTFEDIRDTFLKTLEEKKHEEILSRVALVGPHRDDFEAFLDERLIGPFGSQGENRSAVIALKLAQLKLYYNRFKKMPLFLLDDVASELDANRCRYLFNYLRDASIQAFLTTTENQGITADFLGKSQSFQIHQGQIVRS